MGKQTMSWPRRCWNAWMAMLACGSLLGNLLWTGMLGAPLALVSMPAQAACTLSGSTSSTFTYTAATINSTANLSLPTSSWACRNPNDGSIFNPQGPQENSAHICYRATFTNTVNGTGGNMNYTLGLNDTVNQIASMTSGTTYGLFNTPVSGATPLDTTLTVTVPAGQTVGKAAGTYSNSNIVFAFDEQGNGGACEANYVSSKSNWDAGGATYTANFVIPTYCLLISTDTVDFGNLSEVGVLGAPVNAQGGVTVQCSSGTHYTVYLGDGGQRITGGDRRMRNGTALLSYQLYKDSARTEVWDATGGTTNTNGSGGVNGIGNGLSQMLPVYAQIPTGTTIPGTLGTYTDTVIVTVTY